MRKGAMRLAEFPPSGSLLASLKTVVPNLGVGVAATKPGGFGGSAILLSGDNQILLK
jgi:hypothetical protein